MAHSDKTVSAALQDYMQGNLYTKEIAKKYNVSPSTITVWATTAGIKLRSRGRRKQDEPSIKQKKIIELAQVLKYEEVGKRFGISKQAVHRVLLRWKNHVKPKRPPFAPGDLIEWRGQRFTVYSAEVHSGTLLDKRGSLVRCFSWNSHGRMPKKVGVNESFLAKIGKVAAA